jgi:hypothetical protein
MRIVARWKLAVRLVIWAVLSTSPEPPLKNYIQGQVKKTLYGVQQRLEDQRLRTRRTWPVAICLHDNGVAEKRLPLFGFKPPRLFGYCKMDPCFLPSKEYARLIGVPCGL